LSKKRLSQVGGVRFSCSAFPAPYPAGIPSGRSEQSEDNLYRRDIPDKGDPNGSEDRGGRKLANLSLNLTLSAKESI